MLERREMEMTADLVRERLATHPMLQPLADAGRHAMLGYSESDIWLTSGDREIARFRWRGWWRPGLDTRQDRAAEVANTLVVEALSRWQT